ncbi:MAG: hypothetical protein B7Z53_03465, partial [Rhodospirillales bacterium 12-71-4]
IEGWNWREVRAALAAQPLLKNDSAGMSDAELMQAIGFVATNLRVPDQLLPAVIALGERHGTYGVQPAHYDTVATALLDVLQDGLGTAFTPELREAWAAAYALLAETMIAAAGARSQTFDAQARALAPEVDVQLLFRPYELDPTIPAEGVDYKAYMSARVSSPEGKERMAMMRQALIDYGEAEGIPYRFDAITHRPNSFDAHRLVRLAERHGMAAEAVDALFQAYFCEGEDIGEIGVLVAVAAGLGMDPLATRRLLASPAEAEAVHADNLRAHRLGINSGGGGGLTPVPAPDPLAAMPHLNGSPGDPATGETPYRFQRPGKGIGFVAAPFGAGGTLPVRKTVFLKAGAAFGAGPFGGGGGGALGLGTLPCATSASAASRSRAARMRAS